MSIFLKLALEYEAIGFSVIPVLEGKKEPHLPWKEFQTRRATKIEIVEWWKYWPNANVGIVTGAISGVCVVDFDRYKEIFNPENELLYFPTDLITPLSHTPRGGLHRWFGTPPEPISGRADVMPGIDFRCEGNFIVAPPSLNGSGKPYAWAEGYSIFEVTPPPVPQSFINLFLQWSGGMGGRSPHNKDINTLYIHGAVESTHDKDPHTPQVSTKSTDLYTIGRRDEDLFHLAHSLVKSRCDYGFIYKTLNIIAQNCNPPFPMEEANIKIKSAMERASRKERNLMAEIREWVLSTNGIFLSTDIHKCLQLSTREDLKNCSECLRRLIKPEGLIVRHGNKNGMFRCVDQEEELIDYKSVDTSPYEIHFPLDVHKYVTIHKGNIIVLAGESNAGKTAMLMNIAWINRALHDVNYMTSEMQNGTELRVRMDKFNVPIESWDPIKFHFRTDNFPDKIEPDGLNIVDYLDEGSDAEAYKMPHRLREIADRLKEGIAIVAIQKSPGKEFGFGGAGTLNRARLYMTITKENVLKVVKGKIWKNELINPNGMFCKFKLIAGCKFVLDGQWTK